MIKRKEEDGWVSYGITAKGILVVYNGTWRLVPKIVTLNE